MKFKSRLFSAVSKRLTLGSENFDNERLCDSENVLVKKSGIVTRPGMKLAEHPIIYDPEDFAFSAAPLSLTDFFLNINGRKAQIAIATEDDGISNIYYHIYAVYSDCTKDDLGSVIFTRVDTNIFGIPEAFVVFSGKPVTGGGIFLLAHVVYSNGQRSEMKVFEINSSFDGWRLLPDNLFYKPTVLIHGRGDNCHNAFLNTNLKLSVPRRLEPLNMLYSAYYLYYTTDGYSSTFTLPDNGFYYYTLNCTVAMKDGIEVTFSIGEANTDSYKTAVGSKSVVMKIDRAKSIVSFEEDDGSPFCFDYIGRENNLRFSLTATDNSDALLASSMTEVCTFTAKSSGGGSTVAIFYNSDRLPDDILWIDPDRPLYFPKTCRLSVTSPTGKIDRVIDADGKLLIFKRNTVFAADLDSAEEYDLTGIINGIADSGKVNFPTLKLSNRVSLAADVIPTTVKSYLGDICFCGEDKKIYRIDRALSVTDNGLCFEGELDFATMIEHRYVLARQGRLYISDPELGTKLFCWTLPAEPLAAGAFGDRTVFFARNKNNAIYGFVFDGENDTFLDSSDTEPVTKVIESSITLFLASEPTRTKLYSLKSELSSPYNVRLRLFDGESFLSENILSGEKAYIHRPILFGKLIAEYKMKGKSELSEIALTYSELNKI